MGGGRRGGRRGGGEKSFAREWREGRVGDCRGRGKEQFKVESCRWDLATWATREEWRKVSTERDGGSADVEGMTDSIGRRVEGRG